MFEKIRNLLNNIQNSDEKTKKRWLIGSSAVTMIIVISLWLVYLNFSIRSQVPTDTQPASAGFWQILKTGATTAIDSIKTEVKNLISKINSARTITIK